MNKNNLFSCAADLINKPKSACFMMAENEQLAQLQKAISQNLELISSKLDTTNEKIANVQQSIDGEIQRIDVTLNNHNERINTIETKLDDKNNENQIQMLQIEVEQLKQDRLKNNIRLTGLPAETLVNPVGAFMQIVDTLKLELLVSDITAYTDHNKSSLIVIFYNQMYKRLLMNTLRDRKVLLVEEVFPDIRSNAKIYANDQLTPYFAKLFQTAWNAKSNGRLFSASSTGGRIKVKKTANSPLTTIECEATLHDIINETEQNNPIDDTVADETKTVASTTTENSALSTRNEGIQQNNNIQSNKSNSYNGNNVNNSNNNNNNKRPATKFHKYINRLNHHDGQYNGNKQQQQKQYQQRRGLNRHNEQDQLRFNNQYPPHTNPQYNPRENYNQSNEQDMQRERRGRNYDRSSENYSNYNNNYDYPGNNYQRNFNGGNYQRSNSQLNSRSR